MSGEWSPGGEWGAPSGGGGGGGASLGYYDPSAQPEAPNAADEEFASGLGALTAFNPGSLAGFAATTEHSMLRMVTTPQASATYRIAGVLRAIPSGDWSAWTRISVTSEATSAVQLNGGGLFIADGDADATADLITIGMHPLLGTADTIVRAQRWSAYDAFSATLAGAEAVAPGTTLWMRMRYVSSTQRLSCDISSDGAGWMQIHTAAPSSVIPARIGVFVACSAGVSVASPVVRADFLRFSTSAAADAVTLGRVV